MPFSITLGRGSSLVVQDVISLVVQALGGSAAAAAANSHKSAKAGSDIMLAGIIFQTGVLSADGVPE